MRVGVDSGNHQPRVETELESRVRLGEQVELVVEEERRGGGGYLIKPSVTQDSLVGQVGVAPTSSYTGWQVHIEICNMT